MRERTATPYLAFVLQSARAGRSNPDMATYGGLRDAELRAS